MPGPPLSQTFTYDGTPGNSTTTDKFNTLDRCMIQRNRFYVSKSTGTHSFVPSKKNIPNNSDKGQGAGGGIIITDEYE
jgi:hypothetical protein